MKGNVKKKGVKKNNNEQLRKYMATVKEFLQSHGGGGGQGAEDGGGGDGGGGGGGHSGGEEDHGHSLKLVQRKSRKQLRKEKRKSKKAQMKLYYEGKKEAPQEEMPAEPPKKHKKKKKGKSPPGAKPDPDPETDPAAPPAGKMGKKQEKKIRESRKRALLEANEVEEREIRMLEKFLGYNKRKNKKKLPQSFADDGLDYVLGVIGSGAAAGAMYDSEEDVEQAKEKFSKLDQSDSEEEEEKEEQEEKFSKLDQSESELSADEEEEEEEEEAAGGEGSKEDDLKSVDEDMEDDEDEEDDAGMAEEEEEEEVMEEEAEQKERDEEKSEDKGDTETSPLGPQAVTAPAVKYVPPHLRVPADDKRRAELETLRRRVKGLLNRLSEANMASIAGQLEEMYMSCSRKDMSETLTEVLLATCISSSLMPDRLLQEHVLLISLLHHSVGLEVGAHFLETVVRRFDAEYRGGRGEGEGKEADNLLLVLCHLYSLQVVHCLLPFDLLRRLVAAFGERDLQLVLLVLKTVGMALRKDDAHALKELISEAQRKASELGSKVADRTRVHFMLETMMALKNNDVRKIPGYDPEPLEKMKKLQRALTQGSRGGSDLTLRVSLDNVLAADQVGRWWIVGSSWSGAPMIDHAPGHAPGNTPKPTSTPGGQFSAKVLELARKQRMNTDVRRNIFCVVMTSEDYLDAFEKLLRMGLKEQQEREIVHVLMDCCLQEKTFNPFYSVLGEKFCSHDRRFQMTFQFCLWDKFKELASLPSSMFSNLVQMVTRFLLRKSLSLSILKVIEFGELDKARVRFLRQVLSRLLKDGQPEELVAIFSRISGVPQLSMLREGLKLFISHFLLKNAESQGSGDHALLLEHAQIATTAMEAKDAKLKL